MLNTVQEKLDKNLKKVDDIEKDMIEQVKRYIQDKRDMLHNEAIKE